MGLETLYALLAPHLLINVRDMKEEGLGGGLLLLQSSCRANRAGAEAEARNIAEMRLDGHSVAKNSSIAAVLQKAALPQYPLSAVADRGPTRDFRV